MVDHIFLIFIGDFEFIFLLKMEILLLMQVFLGSHFLNQPEGSLAAQILQSIKIPVG